MNLYSNIRHYRQLAGMSQNELAKKAGYKDRSSIAKIEAGIVDLSQSKIKEFADIFGVREVDLMYGNKFSGSELEVLGKVEASTVYPFIPSSVSAGLPITIEGLKEFSQISVPDYLLGKYAGSKNVFLIKVNGESMNNVIPSGSLVGVYMNYPIENLKGGDIVIFNHEYEYSMKRYYDGGDVAIFRPDSQDESFTDIVLKKDENLKIVGKVVMYTIVVD